MILGGFETNRKELEQQFEQIHWIIQDEMDETALIAAYEELLQDMTGQPKSIIKAKTFELILTKAPIAIDKNDIFQDKLLGAKIMHKQRSIWKKEVQDTYLQEEYREQSEAWNEFGAYKGMCDFGHTSPNSQFLLQAGITGIIERVEKAAARENLTDKQRVFYESCRIVWSAMRVFIGRLADAVEPYNAKNSQALRNIATGAPENIYEAMQLLIVYFFLHEYIAGTRVRTLGRLDVLLYPFYKKDLENGTFTHKEVKEMLKYFLHKFWAAKIEYDLPFALGGMDADGNEVTNDISYLIVETYEELNIYSPKIHIRVSDKTPEDFQKLVLRCIRGGKSSFVFVNDKIGIKALMRVGIEEKDAKDYVPIGCYEPAVWGVEMGCTGNGGVNLAKAVELVVTNGTDLRTGKPAGIKTGKIDSYEAFVAAVKMQISYMTEKAIGYIKKIEGYYMEINPDPILSAMYDQSVEKGVDVYEGGAKYNNSSLYFYSIASLVDSMAAVKRLVFDMNMVSFEELSQVLKENWKNYEKLRLVARKLPEKYGNNNAFADQLAKDMSEFVSDLILNQPNGRGGVFKPALFSTDHCFLIGERTMATPDGRLAGEPLSKNLCASTAMDRNGVTALINSVTKMDHSKFPTGSVLDIVLHPSAVSGEDGLEAFYGILKTYFSRGGFAMHGNVFDASTLKKAQKNPEQFANLQVRVCGWNAYFTDLSKAEQDAFIAQAENAV